MICPYLLFPCKINLLLCENGENLRSPQFQKSANLKQAPTHKVQKFKKCSRWLVMHMSSACPWSRTPGQPGEYVGEYKGMNWLLCPWAGENSRHCFEFEGKGWGNSKFCKIHRCHPRRYQGDLPLSPTHKYW